VCRRGGGGEGGCVQQRDELIERIHSLMLLLLL